MDDFEDFTPENDDELLVDLKDTLETSQATPNPGQPHPPQQGYYPGQPQAPYQPPYPGQPQGPPQGYYPGQPQGPPQGYYPGQPQVPYQAPYPGQPQFPPHGYYPGQPPGPCQTPYPGQPQFPPQGYYPGQPPGPQGYYPGQPLAPPQRRAKKSSTATVIIIVSVAVFVLLIIPIFLAVAIPQYNKYRMRSQDSITILAIDAIISAEQIYYTDNNHYSNSYEELSKLSLTKDEYINYGPINIINYGNDFTFTISHKAPGATLFIYDSSNTDQKYKTISNKGLKDSVW